MARDGINIEAPLQSGRRRITMNILGGTIQGPELEGTVLEHGGADWGIAIDGTDVYSIYSKRVSAGIGKANYG
jgi:hypothetical protein